jgi:hypothetical protein
MTVAELIKKLEKMPQDSIVKLNGSRGHLVYDVIYDNDYECVIIINWLWE